MARAAGTASQLMSNANEAHAARDPSSSSPLIVALVRTLQLLVLLSMKSSPNQRACKPPVRGTGRLQREAERSHPVRNWIAQGSGGSPQSSVHNRPTLDFAGDDCRRSRWKDTLAYSRTSLSRGDQ